MLLALDTGRWQRIRDAMPEARAMYERHYSVRHYRDGRRPRKFIGPGEYLALMTADGRALCVWKKFIDASGQQGINCAIFRNEGAGLSSLLILAAERLAWEKWPGERLYTYVGAGKVMSANPGYCFKCAGWRFCGRTKSGLHILEKLPDGG